MRKRIYVDLVILTINLMSIDSTLEQTLFLSF